MLLGLIKFETSAPAGAPYSSFAHFLGLGGAGQVFAPSGSSGFLDRPAFQVGLFSITSDG